MPTFTNACKRWRSMAKPKTVSAVLTRHQTLWIVAAVIGVFLPLTPYLPFWLTAICALALVWRGWLLWQRMPLPPGWLVNVAAMLGAIGIGMHFHTLLDKDSGVALLALLLALKLFEMRSVRDGFFVTLLGYFLVLSQFFYTQSLATATTMIITVVLITAAMINLNREQASPFKALRLSAVMLLQALPFMVLLFVLFPRISGPLWGLPQDSASASSGLSDSMAPGSISQLSLSDAIAFRARFEGDVPEKPLLYWRGPVMNTFDGRTWFMTKPHLLERLPQRPAKSSIDYEVTLEPNARYWLFAIEFPTRLAPDSFIADDRQLFTKNPVRARLRYAMSSDPGMRIGIDETADNLRQALDIPPKFNPRSRALAADLRAKYPRDGELVERMLAFYRKEAFTYTLSPPLLGRNSVDEFLFETRRGFCEHFASSFVFVMRAAGIPTRVVTGYQGGETNPVDGYLVVRQSDAHAWAEVWLKDKGWIRVDPTAAIAPNRVENNLAAAVPAGDPIPLFIRPELSWLRDVRFRWDALANAWNQWVLGYDTERQQQLLRALGMRSPDWQSMTATLAALCGIVMLALTAWTLRQWHRIDPLSRTWQRFSRKLDRRKLMRLPWEGPRDYAQRIAEVMPTLAADATAICDLYAQLRYGGGFAAVNYRELKHRVRAFRP